MTRRATKTVGLTHRQRQRALIYIAQAAMVRAARAMGARDQATWSRADGALRDAIGELLALDGRLIARVVSRATPEEFRADPDMRQDLRQEGDRAYWRAVELYDPARGTAFSTLVWTTIYRSVRRWIEDHAYTIRVPGAQQRRLRQTLWHRDRLRAELGREPSTEEIAAACRLAPEQVRALSHIPRVAVSLDDDDSEDGPDLAETVAEESEHNPLVYLSRARVLELLAMALDGETVGIVIDSYGLREGGALTVQQIARERRLEVADVRARIRAAVETLAQPHYQDIARAWSLEAEAQRADEAAIERSIRSGITMLSLNRAIVAPPCRSRRPRHRGRHEIADQHRLI